MIPTTTTYYIPSSEEALQTLLECDGNKHLAAERLNTTSQILLTIISQDPTTADTLQNQIRTRTLLTTYHTLTEVNIVLQQTLADLDPQHVLKAYTTLIELLTRLTDSNTQTNNINITEVALRMMPPDVRAAVRLLSESQADRIPIQPQELMDEVRD